MPRWDSDDPDRPWTDEDKLREQYVRRGRTDQELADEWGCARATVLRWRNRYDIDEFDRDRPWYDEERLRERIADDGISPYDLAVEWDCYAQTIYEWMRKYGIGPNGYPTDDDIFVSVRDGYSHLHHRGESFPVHRLAAVAEHGFEAVAYKVVHHKNGIRWVNNPDNLGLFDSQAEHARHHAEENRDPDTGNFA